MRSFAAVFNAPPGAPASALGRRAGLPGLWEAPGGLARVHFQEEEIPWLWHSPLSAANPFWVVVSGHVLRLDGQPIPAPAAWLAGWLGEGRPLESALAQLDGEFCVLAWNAALGQVSISGDRSGNRPIYYSAPGEGGLLCASHAALAAPAAPALDRQSLALYLGLRGVPAPYSLLEGVRKTVPGQLLTVSPAGETLSTWWDPAAGPAQPAPARSAAEAARDVEAALSGAVGRAMANAPLAPGIFLSSGLDSGILASLAVRQGLDLHAFTVGYSPAYRSDETLSAAQAARQLGIPIQVERLALAQLPALLAGSLPGMPEPVLDPSFLPQLHLARQIGAAAGAVLDGTGADGLFGGSNKMIAQGYRQAYRRLPGPLRRGLAPLLNLLPASRRWRLTDTLRKAQFFLAAGELDDSAAEVFWSRLMPDALLRRLLRPELQPPPGDLPGALLEGELRRQAGAGRGELAGVALMTLRFIQPWYELHKHNAIELLSGLSIRKPFLAAPVVGLALALPDGCKVHGGQGKYILRQAFPAAPAVSRQARKRNFSPPVGLWLSQGLKEPFEEFIHHSRLFEPSALAGLARQQALGWRDWQTELWGMFVLESWWDCLKNTRQLLERK